jgi:hypothetical protein
MLASSSSPCVTFSVEESRLPGADGWFTGTMTLSKDMRRKTIEDILGRLTMMFYGAGSNSYSTELLHFVYNLKTILGNDFAYVNLTVTTSTMSHK